MELIVVLILIWFILVILFYGGIYLLGFLYLSITAPYRFYILANNTDNTALKLFYYFGMTLYILLWLMIILAFILI